MAQLRDNLIRSALMLIALGLLGGGILLRQQHMDQQSVQAKERKIQENQKLLLDRLRSKPLFKVSPAGSSHQRAETALEFFRASQEAKIDPMACYHLAGGEQDLRLSLAYMLLVGESQDYLAHAAQNVSQIPAGEVLLWVTLLEMDDRSLLSESTTRQLRQMTLRSPTPPGLWFTAQRYQRAGLDAEAQEYMLQLLETPSAEGIVAAKSLCDIDSHKSRAREYLWEIVRSEQSPLAEDALRRLAQVLQATDWPEYKRYTVDASQANRSALLERLTEASTS
jgi:hypothetical protein